MVTFSQKELQGDPGVYSITVVSSASVESDYTLDIQQASVSGTAQQLHKDDAAALEKVRPQLFRPCISILIDRTRPASCVLLSLWGVCAVMSSTMQSIIPDL